MELYAKGKRGIIYRKGKVCIKVKNPRSSADTLRNEAKYLQILNKKGIGPRFISYKNKKLCTEFIKGIIIKNFLEKENKKKILDVLRQVLEQCRQMDLLGINKKELTNPYKDILVTNNNKAVMIDFERCRQSKKPKNVTQFIQYIAKNKEVLGKKGIIIDKNDLVRLGKEYKEGFDEKSFKRIIIAIST